MVQLREHKIIRSQEAFLTPRPTVNHHRTTIKQKRISVHNCILTKDKWVYKPAVHTPPHPFSWSPAIRAHSASLVLFVYASQSETALGKQLPSYCNKPWVKPSNHWVITDPQLHLSAKSLSF